MMDSMKGALERVQSWASAGGLKVFARREDSDSPAAAGTARPMRTVAAAALMATALTGCATMGPNERVGQIVGAVGGAVIGSQIGDSRAGTAIGTLLGSEMGRSVGRSVDMAQWMQDRDFAYRVHRAPMGRPMVRPYTYRGYHGQMRVIPRHTYRIPQGLYCRQYQTEIYVGGYREIGTGTACQMPNGTWRIMNAPRPRY